METKRSFSNSFSLRNILITAGIAMVAPYVIRRVLPLLRREPTDISPEDLATTGKDSVRDVADDLGIGGVSGKINRAVDRAADRVRH